jgi:hypothetical protein
MKGASKGKYDEQHLLKRVEFIKKKLLQFPEAEATEKCFVRQMVPTLTPLSLSLSRSLKARTNTCGPGAEEQAGVRSHVSRAVSRLGGKV